jgi:hypothetical protein
VDITISNIPSMAEGATVTFRPHPYGDHLGCVYVLTTPEGRQITETVMGHGGLVMRRYTTAQVLEEVQRLSLGYNCEHTG